MTKSCGRLKNWYIYSVPRLFWFRNVKLSRKMLRKMRFWAIFFVIHRHHLFPTRRFKKQEFRFLFQMFSYSKKSHSYRFPVFTKINDIRKGDALSPYFIHFSYNSDIIPFKDLLPICNFKIISKQYKYEKRKLYQDQKNGEEERKGERRHTNCL